MFHRLEFRAHCHATEEEDRVLQAFTYVSGVRNPEVTRAEGFHGNPITIFKASLKSPKAIKAFWERVREAGELDSVIQTLDRRMNGKCQIRLRFDKQEAYRGRIRVVRHDDVISLKAKVAAYPARRERALEAASLYFRGD